jgi:Cu/Ag efflux pump CusA
MRPGLPGYDIDTTIFRPATFIEMSIDNLTESLLVGGFLVVLILLLFLYEWRITLISASIIPLSLMCSLLVLSWRGATINVMTLAGLAIAIGAVVDDAIVDVENIVRRLRQSRTQGSTESTASIIVDASVEVRGPIVYASLVEISALLPVFFLEGLSGSFFQPLALAYVVAGLVSPLIALTVTPALVLMLLGMRRWAASVPGPPLAARLRPDLEPIVARPRRAYMSMAAIVLAGLSVLSFMGRDLLPAFKGGLPMLDPTQAPLTRRWSASRGVPAPSARRSGVRNAGAHRSRPIWPTNPTGSISPSGSASILRPTTTRP